MKKFIAKKIITGVSKKFKGIQKLPAQKTPSKSPKWLSQDADLRARAKFDSIFDSSEDNVFQGVKILATKHAAAQTLASKTAGKKWSFSLNKAIKKQRSSIASFAKSNKGKISKSGIEKAKIKGFVKTLNKHDLEFDRIRSKTEQLFTGSTGSNPFKNYSKVTKRPLRDGTKLRREGQRIIDYNKRIKRDWGF